MKFFRNLFRQLLIYNYSLSVLINDYREPNFSKTCIRITSAELFFILVSVQIILFPKIYTTSQIYCFFLFIVLLFLVSFFYADKVIYQFIKDLRVPTRYEKIHNSPGRNSLIILGSILFCFLFLQFFGLSILEFYNYHTRYFYWNWNY
jgi:hypothetical protein